MITGGAHRLLPCERLASGGGVAVSFFCSSRCGTRPRHSAQTGFFGPLFPVPHGNEVGDRMCPNGDDRPIAILPNRSPTCVLRFAF